MTPETKAGQVATLPVAVAASDQLKRFFDLLGVRSSIRVSTLDDVPVVVLSPLWTPDAVRLADALSTLSELRPYTAERHYAEKPTEAPAP